MELKKARSLAESAIAGTMRLTAALEGTDHWFFIVGDDMVESVPGHSPMAIDKKTGEVDYPMPPIPYVLSGKEPTAAEVEMEQAQEVALN